MHFRDHNRISYPGCDTQIQAAAVSVTAIICAGVAVILLLAASATENFLGYSLLVLAVSLLAERYFDHQLKVSSRELALSTAALARANIDLGYAEARLAEYCLGDETKQTLARP